MTIPMPAFKRGVEYDLSIFETSPISMIVEEQILNSSGLEQEEAMTLSMPAFKQGVEYDLSIFETSPISMIVEEQILNSSGLEQIVTLRIPKIPKVLNAEDDEAFILQTVSIRTVKKKRARNRARALLTSSVVLLLNILFLSGLIAIIIEVSNIIYKLQMLVVLLIAFSYAASLYLKRIRKARQQKYLTVTQFLQVAKKMRSSSEDDMKHFKLVKQDTITYLRALNMKDLKKGTSE